MQGSLVAAKDAVDFVAVGVGGAGGEGLVAGLGEAGHVLEAVLGALLGLLRDVRVVDGGLETSGDALLCRGRDGTRQSHARVGAREHDDEPCSEPDMLMRVCGDKRQ